jgi:hypothetical protein
MWRGVSALRGDTRLHNISPIAMGVARIECPKANEAKVVIINKILNSCELCSSLK